MKALASDWTSWWELPVANVRPVCSCRAAALAAGTLANAPANEVTVSWLFELDLQTLMLVTLCNMSTKMLSLPCWEVGLCQKVKHAPITD